MGASRRSLALVGLEFLLLVAAGALVCEPAHAWGHAGHYAVGAVADRLIDERTAAAVAALLREDRDRHGEPSGRHTLAAVASWPDEIRGSAADHPRWHFDNRPACGGEMGGVSGWCPGGECASAAMERNLEALSDRGRSPRERNEALKWVVHLAGDMHQPLHEAGYAEGGNQIRLARAHRAQEHAPANLHALWDTRLVELALHVEEGKVPGRSVRRLEQKARAFDAAKVDALPSRWAEESNELARSVALARGGESCAIHAGSGPFALPSDYVRIAVPVVDERLALAGARLAHLLERALGQ
jgi:hypothetical protein